MSFFGVRAVLRIIGVASLLRFRKLLRGSVTPGLL